MAINNFILITNKKKTYQCQIYLLMYKHTTLFHQLIISNILNRNRGQKKFIKVVRKSPMGNLAYMRE